MNYSIIGTGPVGLTLASTSFRPLESAQYASEVYRQLLAENGLVGSMGRRGNPYDCESVGAAWRA
jgi:hypothetical protein